MAIPKWGLGVAAAALLAAYNGSQSDLGRLRSMPFDKQGKSEDVRLHNRKLEREQYGPDLSWLDKLAASSSGRSNPNEDEYTAKLDFRVLSSLMVAGLASGFKSQVANLLWMKSDEYWHKGMLTRQNPMMELVVTLDPQFIDAWSTAGWHWAYNIYADIETNPKYKNDPKLMQQKQLTAIETGLGYLQRGSEQNPETYRLWFEHGWTRAEKAGYYDETTAALYRTARAQADARTVYRDVVNAQGKAVQTPEQGIDIIGRTIGHLYERTPDLDRALDQYGNDLLKMNPRERAGLEACARYWREYSSLYDQAIDVYQKGDATIKSRVKAAIPEIEEMVANQKIRLAMQARDGQPTGAFISLVARYAPAWRLYKAGRYQEAADLMTAVMNADPKQHLVKIDKLAQVFELRGDSADAIAAQVKQQREYEKQSSQEIGLHFVARIYSEMARAQTDPAKKKAVARLAYEMWYRGRTRNSLNFYARRQTILLEDEFGFTTPQAIVDQVKASRKGGAPSAAPENAPKVSEYYSEPVVRDRDEDGLDDATGKPVDQVSRESAEQTP